MTHRRLRRCGMYLAGAAVAAHFEKPVAIGGTSSFWFDWVNARILVREAQTLLGR